MTEQNTRLTIGFLKSLADQCGSCYHRNNCDNCFVKTAKCLLNTIGADVNSLGTEKHDYTIAYRMAAIERILTEAKRPLASGEIDVSGICYKQLKYATLRILLRLHRISRVRSRRTGAWLYFINHKKKHTTRKAKP